MNAEFSIIQDLAVMLLTAAAAGWLCRKIGMSAVVGYLLAGVLLAPANFPLPLIDNEERVSSLAAIALIFVVFRIGLNFSIQRLKRQGLMLVVALIIAALFTFNSFRLFAWITGWEAVAAAFVAAMVMVSSSAIITKVLEETGLRHEKTAQRATGLTILEDALVVVMLTVLASIGYGSASADGSVGWTVFILSAFIITLLVLGIVFIPRVLDWLRRNTDAEIMTGVICALLLAFSLISLVAGYTPALGAFLLGAIASDTPARGQIERLLGGAINVLTMLFFTAMGMMVVLSSLPGIWHWILLFTAAALVLRIASYTFALTLTGQSLSSSIQSGLMLVPLGEFSFVVAALGVQMGALDERFFPMAVGASLITSLLAPVLTRHSASLSRTAARLQPRFLADGLRIYRAWLDQLQNIQSRNLLWQISRKRLWQIAREMLLVTGVIVFASPVYDWLALRTGPDLFFPRGTASLYILAVLLLTLPPLVALWRNASAMLMIYAEAATAKMGAGKAHANAALLTLLRTTTALVLLLWLIAILPLAKITLWSIALVVCICIATALLFRRKLVFLHSQIEISLHESFSAERIKGEHQLPHLLESHGAWRLELIDCQLPEPTPFAGKTLQELDVRGTLGVTVAGIERQGHMIATPGAREAVYSNDRLLLLGEKDRVQHARDFLTQAAMQGSEGGLEEFALDPVRIERDPPEPGATLADLRLNKRFGIQIVGIERDGHPLPEIKGGEILRADDTLLVMGRPDRIADFRRYLAEVAPPPT